jgi:hypothetical protein
MTRCVRLALIAFLGVFLSAFPGGFNYCQTARAAQTKTETKEITVWVNTNSSVYHCPGTRWYGKTKQGEFIGECAALKAGSRPTYGKSCGSPCN